MIISAASLLFEMAHDSAKVVMTPFDLFVLAQKLFHDRGYRGTPIPPRNRLLTAKRARLLLSEATWEPNQYFGDLACPDHRLPRDPDFLSPLYIVKKTDAAVTMMDADPFCRLSYGSALAAYRLVPEQTDLHLTTPNRSLWTAAAHNYMSDLLNFDTSDAEHIDDDDMPFPLTRPTSAAAVRGQAVFRHETQSAPSEELGLVAGLRTTPIGAAFRDALESPAWCGGIEQVIDLWRRHALAHLEAIIPAISQAREKIVRVRAGYLLDEVLGVTDPRVEAWRTDAQRGSSRKFNAAAPYAGRFSASWMLSINVDDPSLPATTA